MSLCLGAGQLGIDCPWAARGSRRFDTLRSYMLTMFHGAATGRLLVHDPAAGTTEVLAEGLWFANGVALAPDESYVAVVETPAMRVLRRWLTGPKVWRAGGQGRPHRLGSWPRLCLLECVLAAEAAPPCCLDESRGAQLPPIQCSHPKPNNPCCRQAQWTH